MSKASRDKGGRGERELARILSDELGVDVSRNLLQCRDSGHDLDGLPLVLEVKRHKRATPGMIREWWSQAVRQAQERSRAVVILPDPALAYRVDHGKWRFVVASWLLGGADYSDDWHAYGYDWTVDMGLQPFCLLVRELINEQSVSEQVRKSLESAT